MPVSRTTGTRPTGQDGVVGLADRAEHPVGDRAQTGPVGLGPVRQRFALVHGHIPSSRYVIAVTDETKPYDERDQPCRQDFTQNATQPHIRERPGNPRHAEIR